MSFITNHSKRINVYKKTLIILMWLILWQIFSVCMNEPLIFVGPITTVKALWQVILQANSWFTIGISVGRIGAGFLCGTILGVVLAFIAYRVPFIKELFEPVLTLLKSIPVASFVVLILAWLSSRNLSVFIAGLVTFPIVYFDILDCLLHVDYRMIQLSKVFHVTYHKCFRYMYLPSMMERLCNTARITIGISIRAGVAAELIGLPARSIGEAIYKAKLYFDVADLFAWTILIVVLCYLCERIVLTICRWIRRRLAGDQG